MADKQIKDYAITPLADTDSLVKQSVTGLTARATYGDVKADLDDRYTQKGTVIWEDADYTHIADNFGTPSLNGALNDIYMVEVEFGDTDTSNGLTFYGKHISFFRNKFAQYPGVPTHFFIPVDVFKMSFPGHNANIIEFELQVDVSASNLYVKLVTSEHPGDGTVYGIRRITKIKE